MLAMHVPKSRNVAGDLLLLGCSVHKHRLHQQFFCYRTGQISMSQYETAAVQCSALDCIHSKVSDTATTQEFKVWLLYLGSLLPGLPSRKTVDTETEKNGRKTVIIQDYYIVSCYVKDYM